MINNELQLRILSDDNETTSKTDTGTKGILPQIAPTKVVAKVTGVSPAILSAQLKEFIQALDSIVKELPENCGTYDVDELTCALSIDGSGKLSLLGQLSSGVRSSITLKLKKQR